MCYHDWHTNREDRMFKRIKDYIDNKGLCFTMRSKSKKITVSVCNELDAARIKTPYTDELVWMNDILPALSAAYRDALDAKDQKIADELHDIRHTISEVYA